MRNKIDVCRFFLAVVLVGLITTFSTQFAFAQCGNYFKTGYQKPLPNFSDFQVEDWTGDGKADFWKFQLNPNTQKQDVFIYANNGIGDFDWDNPLISPTTIPVIRQNIDYYELIDFNNDGKKDIFFSQGATLHTVFLNNGSNSFTVLAGNTFNDEPNSPYVRSVGFIDVNSDNILDWVRLNNVSNTTPDPVANFRLGSANGTFGARADIFVTGSPAFPVIGDFNGDGRKDIANASPGSIGVKLNNGNGTFSGYITTLGFRTDNATVKDFNGDGREDIVVSEVTSVSGQYTRHLLVFWSNGSGGFVRTEIPVYQYGGGGEANYVVNLKVADFDGDNSPDIMEMGVNFYSIHLNNGQGAFSRTDYLKKLGESQDLIFAKFNGDNKADIFVKSNNSAYLKNIFNEQIILVKYNQCESFNETKRANFNGDSLPDLVTWNSNTGNWRVGLLGTINDVSTLSFNWGSGSFGDIPALGDFDGDGKTDYSVYRNSDGNWYILLSSNSSWLVFKFGLPGDIPVPSDYNGGGLTDIAVFRPSDGNWYIWFSETQQFSAVHFGSGGDKPVPADYDGDGKTDIAVYRPSEGSWYYLKSSSGSYVVLHWGIETDKPIPADYDGDGKADITVYRDGDWYIFRSSNSSFNFIHFGTATDFPMPFYYNNDSAELMVYRAASIFWYRYNQYNTFPGITFGQSQYVPIYFGLPNN